MAEQGQSRIVAADGNGRGADWSKGDLDNGGRMVGPAQRVVASYPRYQDAERAVDRLADADFPVNRVTIVGGGLRTVELVTGRVTPASAAARSAVTGALLGAVLGWLLGIFSLVDPLVAAIWLAIVGALLGGAIGGATGLIGYALTRGQRSFRAVSTIQADSYDVLVDTAAADEAARLLSEDSAPDHRTDR